MKFSELQLEPSLLTSIEKLNYSECTAIQVAAMPHILDGKDLSGLAQTGTGKTAAFVIPLIDRILKSRNAPAAESMSEEQKAFQTKRAFPDWRAQNFILILVPTRELAEQVYENVSKLGEASGVRGFAVYGGTGYDKQKEAVKNGVEFIVATPGRLIDLYKEHVVDLKQVRAIVFDEADRMFDMGFKDDMKFILGRVPKERQFLVFSATLNFEVLNTAYQFGAEPVEIDVSRDQTKADNVKDEIFQCGHHDKPAHLLSIFKMHNPKQAIIFSNYKHNVDRIARFLTENGIHAMGISSLLTQAQRTRVMEQFRAENEKNILVATDVAARGLDIKGVDMVVNYDLPQDAESYVHRIGRTGRAGATGQAFSLVGDRDIESLSRIEDYLKHKLAIGWIEDKDLLKDFKPFPREESSFRSERPQQGGRDNRGGGRPQGRGGPGGGRPQRDGQRPDNRGPRRDGPRAEGGARTDGPRPQQARDGQRPDNRGPRRDGPRRDGPRTDGPRNDGPRKDGQAPQGQRQGQNGQARRPDNRNPNAAKSAASNGQQPRRNPNATNRRPQTSNRVTTSAAKPASVTGKISKFFKGLIGK